MPAERVLPSDSTLLKWRDQGLTHQQIAERASKEASKRYGRKVSVQRSAVSVALHRAGETTPREDSFYRDYIPWLKDKIKTEHHNNGVLHKLRIGARLAEGEHVTDAELKLFQNWKRDYIDEPGSVVAYNYDDPDGFFYVKRRATDWELIRPPRGAVRPKGVAAPKAA